MDDVWVSIRNRIHASTHAPQLTAQNCPRECALLRSGRTELAHGSDSSASADEVLERCHLDSVHLTALVRSRLRRTEL